MQPLAADRGEVAHLMIMTSGGWTYGGPDAALELLEARMALDPNHSEKLRRQATSHKHLWAWVDEATDRGLARALAPDEQRLPARPPELPDGVHQLWLVDEASGRGWFWNGPTWQLVDVA